MNINMVTEFMTCVDCVNVYNNVIINNIIIKTELTNQKYIVSE